MPYGVLEVNGNSRARIEVGGTRQEISVLLVPEVKAGDYVLVRFGSAAAKIEGDQAIEVMRLYQEIAKADMLQNSSLLRERVNKRKVQNLERYTRYHLKLANQTV